VHLLKESIKFVQGEQDQAALNFELDSSLHTKIEVFWGVLPAAVERLVKAAEKKVTRVLFCHVWPAARAASAS
jgi:hypothetical protein